MTAPALAPWRAVAGTLALAAVWVGGLGLAPLFDVDEGAFASASQEMLAQGDWGHTTLNGADRFDKPILVYWLQAAALALLGPSEFAVRLPSALCALATGLACASFLRPRLGVHTASLVPWLLATALGPMLIGRAATADALLGLLIALAAFDLWRCIEPGATPAASRAAVRRAALWVGLGLLAKGPVALLVPGLAALGWVALQPRGQRVPLLHRLFGDAPAWAVLAAVALPWYAYALARHGRAFVDGFFVRHHLERMAGPLEGHGGGVLYFVVVLPLLLLPWTALLWPLLRRPACAWRAPLERYLLLWAGGVLVFFSLVGTKLPHYGLYAAVPLAALAARQLAAGASRQLVLAVAAASALGAAAALGTPLWLESIARHQADAFWQARLLDPGPVPAAAGLLCAAACAAGWAAWRHPDATHAALVAGAVAMQLAWTTVALPLAGDALQSPVRSMARAAAARELALVQWQLHQPSAGFYLGRPAPRREPQPGEAALTRADRFDASSAAEKAAFDELARERGFVMVLRR